MSSTDFWTSGPVAAASVNSRQTAAASTDIHRPEGCFSLLISSKLQTGCELEGTRASRTKYLACSCTRLAVIHLIEHVAVSGHIGDVEDIEDFRHERQRHGIRKLYSSRQANILGYERVSARKSLRKCDRIDDLIERRPRPEDSNGPIGICDASRARLDVGVVLIHSISQVGRIQIPAERVVFGDAGQQRSADTVTVEIEACQHSVKRRRTLGVRDQRGAPPTQQAARHTERPAVFWNVENSAYRQPMAPIIGLISVGCRIVVVIAEFNEPRIAGKRVRSGKMQATIDPPFELHVKSVIEVVSPAVIDIDGACRALIFGFQSSRLLRGAQRDNRVAYEGHDTAVRVDAGNSGSVKAIEIALEDRMEPAKVQKLTCNVIC